LRSNNILILIRHKTSKSRLQYRSARTSENRNPLKQVKRKACFTIGFTPSGFQLQTITKLALRVRLLSLSKQPKHKDPAKIVIFIDLHFQLYFLKT